MQSGRGSEYMKRPSVSSGRKVRGAQANSYSSHRNLSGYRAIRSSQSSLSSPFVVSFAIKIFFPVSSHVLCRFSAVLQSSIINTNPFLISFNQLSLLIRLTTIFVMMSFSFGSLMAIINVNATRALSARRFVPSDL